MHSQLWYACTQRFIRRRYTRAPSAASATRGNSRQTDLKNSALQRIARFCHAPGPLSVTAKPRFECSGTVTACSSFPIPNRRIRLSIQLVLSLLGRIVGRRLVELAIERRAADFQPARDLGHLAAVMRDRKTDDFAFHLFERPHFAGAVSIGSVPPAGQRRDRYFVTRNDGRSGRMNAGSIDQRLAGRVTCRRHRLRLRWRRAGNPQRRAGRLRS